MTYTHKENNMLEFLVFGTFWFWTSCVVAFILILALAENEKNIFAFLSFVGFLILMDRAGNISVGGILSHPLQLLMWLLIYFAAGTVWSILKWFSKLHQKRDEFMEVKEKWINEHRPELRVEAPIPDGYWSEFAEALSHSRYSPNPRPNYGYKPSSREDLKPDWKKWKGRLTGWILWWPTSMFWTILNDPLVRLANWIRDRFRHVYSKMADRAFNDI